MNLLNFPEQTWIAVQTKPNAFRQAEGALKRQDIPVFSPKVRKTVRRFGRIVPEVAPLFPGYLFVAVDLARPQWRAVKSTTGVSRIITRGVGEPAPLPECLMDGLIGRCDAEGFLLPPRTVSPGDQVRLASGAFADLVAKVERIDERRRVWVLLEILGGLREVRVDISQLRVA